MELLRVEDRALFLGRRRNPGRDGRIRAPPHPGRIRSASRRESLKPLHIDQPEGPSFTLDGNLLQWQNWSLRIGFNHREGMTACTPSATATADRNRSVAHRMSFAEMIVPYRDPSEEPLPANRIRHRRVGPRLHDHVAGARLRLPAARSATWTRCCTTARASRTHHQRHLHPRGRQRRALEARRPRHRRRGAPDAAADDVVSCHRRQLRVPRVLAAVPGRQHRMRGACHRHHGDHAGWRRASRIRTARWSTNARMRRSTNTSWSPGSTWTSTAATTPST